MLLLYCPSVWIATAEFLPLCPVETPCNVSVPAAPMADAGERHGMTRSVAASLSDTGYCTVPAFRPEDRHAIWLSQASNKSLITALTALTDRADMPGIWGLLFTVHLILPTNSHIIPFSSSFLFLSEAFLIIHWHSSSPFPLLLPLPLPLSTPLTAVHSPAS